MTVVHLSPLDLKEARVEGLYPVEFEKGLLQGTGFLESPVIETLFPFDNLVGSWNAELPPEASIDYEAQVRQNGKWTKWYRLSSWTPDGPRSHPRQADRNGLVDVDTLKLERKADAFRYRINMRSAGPREALLTRVAAAYEDASEDPVEGRPFRTGPWVREIPLKPRSQMLENAKYRSDVCSPTALAMVLERWGIDRETIDVVESVRDRYAEIYGNWPLNVAAAASYGLSGQVARLPSLTTLQSEIAAGRPVVASITFARGELSGAPIKSSKGHLVVVAGFTAKGDPIVYDPAAPDLKSVRRVYKRAQFERAWLKNKHGLSFLLGPRFPMDAVIGVPTTDLRVRPAVSKRLAASDRGRVSQLLYGERVRVIEARGDWVRVSAVEQPDRSPSGAPRSYPGWIPAGAIRVPQIPYHPDSVIRAKRAELRWIEPGGLEETLTLPLGASLVTLTDHGSRIRVSLLEGRTAHIHADGLYLLGKNDSGSGVDRRHIVETAALFLGDAYVWGGRSSLQPKPGWGVDCSGLVNLAYRSAGIEIPRDADAQFRASRPVTRRKLRLGDPVFLTVSSRSTKVNHVLLYAGGDGLIESSEAAGRTLRTTFTERFGTPLEKIKSGDIVTDRTRRKPLRRRVLFGSFLGPGK